VNPPPKTHSSFALAFILFATVAAACSSARSAPGFAEAPRVATGDVAALPAVERASRPGNELLETFVMQRRLVDPEVSPAGAGTTTIDNRVKPDEWRAAGIYPFGGEDLPLAMSYIFDASFLYVRVAFSQEALGDDGAGFDLDIGGDNTTGEPLSSVAKPLEFGATNRVSWRGTSPVEATVHVHDRAGSWSLDGTRIATGFNGWEAEIAIPLAWILDRPGLPSRLPFRLFDVSTGLERDPLPGAGPGYFQLADPTWGSLTS